MRLINYTLFLFLFLTCEKLDYKNVEICNYSLNDISGNKLVILSDSECGYCQKAYSDLTGADIKKLNIIIVDFSNSEPTLNNNFTVINGNKCKEINKPDFFPQLFLFNSNNKLIWKKKGWFPENIEEIKSKLQ